jgi:hypothetical protein
MKSLTVEEATPGLGRSVGMALAGEQIPIRKGSGAVELRPAQPAQTAVDERLTPREALRRLQEDARLTPQQAAAYLRELREERQAAAGGTGSRSVQQDWPATRLSIRLLGCRDGNLSAESLYRQLSRRGNPRLASLNAVLTALRLKLCIAVG